MAIPRQSSFSGSFLKPPDDVDPNKKAKNPVYSLNWSKYIYSQFMSDNSAIKSEMATRFVKNRSYSVGRQDTSPYKNWITGKSKDGPPIPVVENGTDKLISDLQMEDLGLENINFEDIFSPLPKYVKTIVGIMRSQQHDISVDAVDENSGTLREEMKYRSLITEQLKPLILRFNQVFGIPDSNEQPVKPRSVEELELFDNIGAFKLPVEIAMEKVLAHTFDMSSFDEELKDRVVTDFAVDGYSCVSVSQDVTNGKFIPEHRDTLDVILEDSKKEDFSDATWGGYIEYYTAHKLRIETGWSEKKIQELVGMFSGEFGNPRELDISKENGQYRYDDYKIPVIVNFWKTVDSEYYSERKTGVGPVQVYEPWKGGGKTPPKKRNNRELDKVSIRRLYKSKWVIGSEDVFDYGPVTNSPYDFGINDTEFPIRIFRIYGKPPIESMIPIEDQIYLTFIKTQNAIAKAAPPGLAVEWGSVQNISYGKTKLTPKDSIRLYTNTGNIVYQLDVKTLPGQQGSNRIGKPIEELRGGLGTAIAEGIQGIEFLYRQLDVISGIDGLTSSTTTPNRDTGKAVSEMAVAATSNTLKPIYNGFITLKEGASKVVIWQVQALISAYSIKDIHTCPYFRALGRANLTALLAASDVPVVYGLSIEAKAQESEKQRILEAASAGMQGGKNGIPALTYSEYSFIVRYLGSGKSIKYLELWMAKKEQERAEADKQKSKELIITQEEELRKTNEKKFKAEERKYALETEKELAKIKEKGEQDRLTLREKFEGERAMLQDELRLKELSSVNNPSVN